MELHTKKDILRKNKKIHFYIFTCVFEIIYVHHIGFIIFSLTNQFNV